MMRRIVLFVLVSLLASCTGSPVALSVQDLAGKGMYPPQPYVDVLSALPSAPYVPVARLVATGASGLEPAQIVAAIEDKARQLGANAVVLSDETRSGGSTLAYNPAGGQYGFSGPSAPPRYGALAIHVGKQGEGLAR